MIKFQKHGEGSIKDTYSGSHYLIHEDRLQVEVNKKLLARLEYLEAENEYLKKIVCPNSKEKTTIKERALIIRELGHIYKLSMLLKIANIPKSTYFYVIEHLTYKSDKDKEIKELILNIIMGEE